MVFGDPEEAHRSLDIRPKMGGCAGFSTPGYVGLLCFAVGPFLIDPHFFWIFAGGPDLGGKAALPLARGGQDRVKLLDEGVALLWKHGELDEHDFWRIGWHHRAARAEEGQGAEREEQEGSRRLHLRRLARDNLAL